MHPFYEHSGALLAHRDSRALGLMSMAAYLAFWAAAIPVALRMLRSALATGPGAGARIEGGRGVTDPAVEIVRARYARGEIDRAELLERLRVLDLPGAGRRDRHQAVAS